MTHDPLCDWRPCTCPLDYDVPQRGHRISCPEYDCECDLIAKVRTDERKQAGVRVANLTSWEDGWPENVVVSRMSAIYAAEGEENE